LYSDFYKCLGTQQSLNGCVLFNAVKYGGLKKKRMRRTKKEKKRKSVALEVRGK
jgi:hypothetical protein